MPVPITFDKGGHLTEAQWLSAAGPFFMLWFLPGKVSKRKLCLFTCACCRDVWGLLADARARAAVETAERFADGEVTRKELRAARWEVGDVLRWGGSKGVMSATEAALGVTWPATQRGAVRRGAATAEACREAADVAQDASGAEARWAVRQRRQAALLRCIAGNPFRPPPRLDPSWLTPGVAPVARAAYEERRLPSGELDPQRLAVLADALEEAGCTDAEILGHLRGPGPHVRGCWVLDIILAKDR